MAFRYCNHIKSDGIQCHSPAKRDAKYCYYHSLYRHRIRPAKHTPEAIQVAILDRNRNLVKVDVQEPCAQRYRLGVLEDGPALQVAISTVVNALADNRLDIGRASTLLYGLQLASTNLRTFHPEPPATSSTAGTYAQVPAAEQLTITPKSEPEPDQELTNPIQGEGDAAPVS